MVLSSFWHYVCTPVATCGCRLVGCLFGLRVLIAMHCLCKGRGGGQGIRRRGSCATIVWFSSDLMNPVRFDPYDIVQQPVRRKAHQPDKSHPGAPTDKSHVRIGAHGRALHCTPASKIPAGKIPRRKLLWTCIPVTEAARSRTTKHVRHKYHVQQSTLQQHDDNDTHRKNNSTASSMRTHHFSEVSRNKHTQFPTLARDEKAKKSNPATILDSRRLAA